MTYCQTPLAGLFILVVEDEVIVALMLEDMLRDMGCTVALAGSVEKALASIRATTPNGVLLDMNLRGQNTLAVADELVRRSVPFLLVTGYRAADSDPPIIKAAPRIQKPFSQDILNQRMKEVFLHSNPAAALS